MKYNYLLGMVLFFSIQLSFAQFMDDMEWDPVNCPDHWTGWGTAGCPLVSTSYSRSGVQSGYIPNDGSTDIVLDLGNKIFGSWAIEFWMYIPSGKEAYWNLQGEVPVGTGEWIVGNIFFNQDTTNPGVGYIDDCVGAPVTFTFPHNQWFRIAMAFDINAGIGAAQWTMSVDNAIVIPEWTPFTNQAGTYPTSLGGINFFSISANNELYIDDFCYSDFGFCTISNTDDFAKVEFSIFPNPAQNTINIESTEEISQITLYSHAGQKVVSQKFSNEIDISRVAAGLYFIEVETQSGKGIQKFIKN